MKARTLAAIAAAALGAGCADNNTSLEWFAICAPPPECTFGTSCDTEALGPFYYDPSSGWGFDLFIEMHNQRPNNADPTVPRLNTNDAFLRTITVSFTGPIPIPGQTAYVAKTIEAESSGIAHVPVATTAATIAALGAAMDQDVVAHVVATGIWGDDSTFQTGTFDVPIRVCSGCTDVACSDGSTPVAYCPHPGQWPAAPVCTTTAP
jgi:hypothetical protein